MRVAIIGTGISGLVSAFLLHKSHDLTLYEAEDYVGGHTHTVPVEVGGTRYAVDTGFIVYNERTYPNFCRLLEHLQVPTQPSTMSFSVSSQESGIEYSSESAGAFFAQRSNIFRPPLWKLLYAILRFNKRAKIFLADGDASTTLKAFLEDNRFGSMFIDLYIVPMLAAIWSADPDTVLEFPALHFFRFLENHGLINMLDRPKWRVIQGGSSAYVEPLTRGFRDRIRLSIPVRAVRRNTDSVAVTTSGGETSEYDHVVLAVHSSQALEMLQDATEAERDILGSIGYQKNNVLLHTDASLMPRTAAAWASWNYAVPSEQRSHANLTYYMNKLQNLEAPCSFLVTLNPPRELAEEKMLGRFVYEHPVYSREAIEAQRRHSEISGVNRSHYCGAYWGYGFHEDGVKSALDACTYFDAGALP